MAVAALAGTGVCLTAASGATPAKARRVIGITVSQGMAGVRLGDDASVVERRLGKPRRVAAPVWSYRYGLAVGFDYWGHVDDMAVSSSTIRTATGIGPGSTPRELRRRYPRARCYPMRMQSVRPFCFVRSRYRGRGVESDFLFGKGLKQIDIYYR